MRLLQLGDHGELSLTRDLLRDIPPYAILSHTWGPDADEVNFKDLQDGTGKTKEGYKKILFCGNQAKLDCLQYFWVDTCCIDKSNNSELSEAIISMFRWYSNATKCYVYLSDVIRPVPDADHANPLPRYEDLKTSRWFTRGWTLQELVAPASVEFYTKDRKMIGNKVSLEQDIHEITKIPVEALRGSSLASFTTIERLSWTSSRQTSREEDMAYSLLGIFDVNIPPLYGEGKEKALSRLREAIDKNLKGESSSSFSSLKGKMI